MTYDREGIDRGSGGQRRDTQQNGVQGDRIDRHPTQDTPDAHPHNTQRPSVHSKQPIIPYERRERPFIPDLVASRGLWGVSRLRQRRFQGKGTKYRV